MDILSYSLAALVAFLGLAAGVVLAFISPEEMPTGRKLFPLLQKIILAAIAAIFISLYVGNIYFRFLLYTVAILLLNLKLKPVIVYPLLAFPFFFSSANPNAFMATAVLIFAYGLPAGSLYAANSRLDAARFVLTKLSFIFVAVALYLIL